MRYKPVKPEDRLEPNLFKRRLYCVDDILKLKVKKQVMYLYNFVRYMGNRYKKEVEQLATAEEYRNMTREMVRLLLEVLLPLYWTHRRYTYRMSRNQRKAAQHYLKLSKEYAAENKELRKQLAELQEKSIS